jgi:4-hydroxybenzoate polyprenyltransferase
MEGSKNQSTVLGLLSISRALLLSARPKQWTKNLIIFFALFFTVNERWDLGDPGVALSMLGKTTLAFGLFSALSGAVYLVNDIFDVENDRRHPRKRHRPIASGELPIPVGWAGAAGLMALSIGLSFVLERHFGWVALGYLALMLAYSLVLKRIVLLDVFTISGGFVLRAVAGAAVLQVPISPWLYICTGLGALMIALSKRRSELALGGDDAGRQRDTLDKYTTSLLDQFIAIVAPSTLLAYTLYTFTAPNLPENHAMMLTIPFVVYGLFRYVFLVHARDLGESPEDILITDVPLIVSIALWLATAATVLLVFRG